MKRSVLQKAHEEYEAMVEVVKMARAVEAARWMGVGSQKQMDDALARLGGALADLDDVRALQQSGTAEKDGQGT